MLFDSRYKNFKGKLTTRWMGPYEVVTTFDNGSIEIKTIDGTQISFVVNGHRLRLYHQPMSKKILCRIPYNRRRWIWLKRKSFLLLMVLKLFWVIFICIYVDILLFLQKNKTHF